MGGGWVKTSVKDSCVEKLRTKKDFDLVISSCKSQCSRALWWYIGYIISSCENLSTHPCPLPPPWSCCPPLVAAFDTGDSSPLLKRSQLVNWTNRIWKDQIKSILKIIFPKYKGSQNWSEPQYNWCLLSNSRPSLCFAILVILTISVVQVVLQILRFKELLNKCCWQKSTFWNELIFSIWDPAPSLKPHPLFLAPVWELSHRQRLVYFRPYFGNKKLGWFFVWQTMTRGHRRVHRQTDRQTDRHRRAPRLMCAPLLMPSGCCCTTEHISWIKITF